MSAGRHPWNAISPLRHLWAAMSLQRHLWAAISPLRHLWAAMSAVLLVAMLSAGCSSSRHVPQGKLLLDRVTINVDEVADEATEPTTLARYLRQRPNRRILGSVKLALGIYNMSGRDSSRWYNRWVRSVGEAPVVYDNALAKLSQLQLQLALVNSGYDNPQVTMVEVADSTARKMHLRFDVSPGRRLTVDSVVYNIANPTIREAVMADSAAIALTPGMPLDRRHLDNERTAMVQRLRNRGFFDFKKEYIRFVADTVAGNDGVGLEVHIDAVASRDSVDTRPLEYIVSEVKCIVDDPGATGRERRDTADMPGMTIIYTGSHYLRPGFLADKCFIRRGDAFNASAVSRTYESLSQTAIIKYANIEFRDLGTVDGKGQLEAIINISRVKTQSVSLELDGTNSEGDLGFGAGITYRHRNIFHGSEQFTAKIRGSYESLSGDFKGFINDRYTEIGAETGIAFPGFAAPFVSDRYRHNVRATSELGAQFNLQERPEYTRVIFGASWRYRWRNRANTLRHTFSVIDINYVKLPRSTIDFINTIAPNNPLLRYSYEDHLIMFMGYTYRYNNRIQPTGSATASSQPLQRDISSLRVSFETAGNLLYAISNIFHRPRPDGVYKVVDTPYAQYSRVDFDYTGTHYFNRRNSIAWHVGAGIGVPYGNSTMMPFEKRFFAGGANSVRGWGVRTLGPGCYDSRNSVTDFINQCGDIRLDLSVEYRAKLFWVVEGALFVDAGNIWTIRNYENQPGGLFRIDEFYKQIALAYGAGIRLDFNYFILRFDLGMKAHNPALNAEPWPLIHPDWKRDHSFHFSIGYPF